jgi:hypothetical protein
MNHEFPPPVQRFFESQAAYDRASRAYSTEKRRARWFVYGLMSWFGLVVGYHLWPYVSTPTALKVVWTGVCIIGLLLAALGGMLAFAWVCTFGRLLDDDYYEH